jgi:hypothetical protein
MKRVMARAARVMATATKRAMVTNGDNMGNCYGQESGRHLTAATIAMGLVTALLLQLERGG